MSKANDIKNKLLSGRRDPRQSLMGGSVQAEPNNNNDVNVNPITNVNINNDVDKILNKKNVKSDKLLVGIYFKPEVKRALDKLQQREGKGAKSEFVNDIVEWALKQKGYLQ
ncbi:hypothetical protein [Heyndrickxia acidicola]|uniref:Ribbon-helix-helix protein CopG domain-containing protein n=1 Tax=Heyndrickxia acidicola TaxID=209389 RepID=A0ABU6MLM0_9BACI|nr:hypothetical protein [Heyndrickxia acidicola]MED1205576.1 hypothetical protein [Heyndrickxia acidicola]